MIKQLKFILFFSAIISFSSVFADGLLNFTIKPIDANGKVETIVWALVEIDGKRVDMIASEKGKGLIFQLEFDKNYVLVLNSKKYEPLTIKVNTHLSKDDKGYNYDYAISLELIDIKPGMEPKYNKDPTLKVVYNSQKQNFGLKSDYKPDFKYVPKKVKKLPEPEKEEPKEKIVDVKKEEPNEATQEKPEGGDAETNAPANTPKEKTDSIPKEKIANATKPETVEEKPKEIIKPKVDLITPISKRQMASKKKISELENIYAEDEEDVLINLQKKTYSKRSFLEDVSDSKIALKQKQRNYQPQN